MVAAVIGFAVSSVVEAVATEVIVGSILEAGIIGGIAETVGASVLASGIGTIAGGLASTAVRSAFSSSSGATQSTAPQAVAQAAEIARGILLNTSGTIDPLNVIYGSRKVGGTLVYAQASGATNEYLHLVLALGEGEISSIAEIYLDNEALQYGTITVPAVDAYWTDGYKDENGNWVDPVYVAAVAGYSYIGSANAKFASLVTIETYVGTDGQAASAALIAACSNWTGAHTLSGVAYLYIRLQYDQNVFHNIPTITCDVHGKRVYDPRDSTTKFSNNPALCIRDYLTNTRYGRGIPTAAMDDSAIIAAANACDVSVAIPGGSTQATYTCDGLVNTDAAPLSNLSDLLTACRGFVVFSGGLYKLKIDGAGTAAFAFTEDNIVGQWSIKLPEKRNRANRVRATYFDPLNSWQPNIAVQESITYRTEDNGVLLECEFSLPYTADIYRAQQIAQQALKQSRKQTLCQFTATIAGLRCEVGDLVTITHSTPGWSAKIFRVMRMALLSSDEVEVTAIEYDANVYNLDPLVLVSPLPGTTLPTMEMAAPASLVLASGANQLLKQSDGTIVSRIRATWPAATSAFCAGAEVQQKLSSHVVWQTVATPGAMDTVAYLYPVQDGAAYDVRVRYVNSLGAAGPWTTVANHIVIGKIEPPENVQSFFIDGDTLTWSAASDIDLAGYRVRFNYGSTNQSWGTANALHVGLLTDSPYTMLTRPVGPVVLMVKAVDTSGNESLEPACIFTDLGDPLVANVIESYNYHSHAFPGTRTGGTIEGGSGDLIAGDASGRFWNALDTVDMWSASSSIGMWPGTSWTPMSYEFTFSPSIGAVGSSLTLPATIAGASWSILYRQRGINLMWSGSSLPMWSVDDSMWSSDPTAVEWMNESSSMWRITGDMWTAPAFSPWPSSVTAQRDDYDFRIAVDFGVTRGRISALVAQVDVPDRLVSYADAAIGSSGSRLSIGAGWFAVTAVQLTLQDNGGSGATARVMDKNSTLGPLVKVFNASGTAVSGVVDAIVQGY